jgi:signal transduction histidine kinase
VPIDFKCPPAPIGSLDGPRIEQVLINLLSNSTKYAKGKGKPISITMKEVGDTIQIAYRDNGPGIPSDKKETIFEAFERLEYTSKTTNGLGLGLFIVKQIISGHRGTVELQKVPTDGASFLICLPRDARSVYLSAAQSTWGTPVLSASIKSTARKRLSYEVANRLNR